MHAVFRPSSFQAVVGVSLLLHALMLLFTPSLRSLQEPAIRPIPLINLRLGALDAPQPAEGAVASHMPQAATQPVQSRRVAEAAPAEPEQAPLADVLKTLQKPSVEAQPEPEPQSQAQPPVPIRRSGADPSASGAAQAGGQLTGNPEGRGEEGITRYGQILALWIQKYKVYPNVRVGAEQAVVRVRINRAGRVVLAWLEESSGNQAVDDAALAMVHAASPVPPVPEWYEGEVFEFLLPVSFGRAKP